MSKQFKLHNMESAPEGSRKTLEGVKLAFGMVPNLAAVMAENPEVVNSYFALSDAFGRSGLTPTEQQVVLLTVSYENRCNYCVAAHNTIAKMQKIDTGIIEALKSSQPLKDSKIQVLRELASAMVKERGWISEEVREKFFGAGYNQSHLLAVILGVTQKTLSNYVNHIAETPIDEAFEGT
ncbi:MAG: carboxymuconolactone decarboxylase family protein [Bdellovibrionales bacterium]